MASSFPRRLYPLSVSTGSPFAAGWIVSVQPLVLCGSRTMVFGTVGKRSNRYATHTCNLNRNINLKINNINLKQENYTKYLGVIIDDTLNWKLHIK